MPRACCRTENSPCSARGRFELIPLNARTNRQRRPWRICQPITLVGRHRHCRPRLNHDSVARFHSSLIATPAGLYAADLRSGRGTFVNGQPTRFRRLRDKDLIGIGNFQLQVRYPEPDRETGPGADEVSQLLQQQLLAMSHQQTQLLADLLQRQAGDPSPVIAAELARIDAIDKEILQSMTVASTSGGSGAGELVERLSALNDERSRRMQAVLQSLGHAPD